MLWNEYMQRKEFGHYIQGKGQNVTIIYLHVINLKQTVKCNEYKEIFSMLKILMGHSGT